MCQMYQRLPARRSKQVIHNLSVFESYEATCSSHQLIAVPQRVLGHCWDAAGDRFLHLRPHLNLIPDASGSLGAAAASQAAGKQLHDCGTLRRCPSHHRLPMIRARCIRLDIALSKHLARLISWRMVFLVHTCAVQLRQICSGLAVQSRQCSRVVKGRLSLRLLSLHIRRIPSLRRLHTSFLLPWSLSQLQSRCRSLCREGICDLCAPRK